MPRRTSRPKHVAPSPSAPPQTTFLAPEDASLLADLTRLRLLVAELTQRYRPSAVPVSGETKVIIRSPKDAAALVQVEMESLPQEELRVLLLTTKNAVIDIVPIYRGTINSSPVRAAEIFRPAIIANAASIVVVHCHPSGDPTPSPEDIKTTSALVQAGQVLDVEVLDHLIIGKGTYMSLKERGLGFS